MTPVEKWTHKAGQKAGKAGREAGSLLRNGKAALSAGGSQLGARISNQVSTLTGMVAGRLPSKSSPNSDAKKGQASQKTSPTNKTPADETFGFDDSSLPGAGDRAFWIGLVVVVLSLISGLATYLILTGLTPIVPRNDVVISALLINVVLVIAMIAIISWQTFGLIKAWRQKTAGARLHVRIVLLFSIIAALPAILLAVSATTTFSRSLDNLFSRSTQSIVANSLGVAKAYLAEHGQVIRNDIVNMTRDLDDAAADIGADEIKMRAQLIGQAGLRGLHIAYIIDSSGKVLVTGTDDVRVPYVRPSAAKIKAASAGKVPLLLPSGTYRVAAITRLENFPGRFLYVARRVNPKVIKQVRRTELGVARFRNLRERRGGMKLAHGLMYFMISLTALLAAIWVGMWFAGRLVAPIRRLIGAAQQVSTGNLGVELPLKRGEGDLRRLSQTFNHMTTELKTQRDDLETVNEQLDERRVFMEAMLSGVSAGVIGLDGQGRITLANRSAEVLLGRGAADLNGSMLADAIPEFGDLVDVNLPSNLRARPQAQVKLEVDGVERSFAVRATQEQADSEDQAREDQGWVVTFDDITELVAAQRTSAWADVAQRIAHEIKNPLTPIQLSAERLKRKYSKVIVEDRDVFDKCTDTIIRQVGDVAAMVDEFSSFARMPKPQMMNCDLREVVREPAFLFEMGNPDIKFSIEMPDDEMIVSCDRRLISRVVTNLVKNASEAVDAVASAKDRPDGFKGRIETIVRAAPGQAIIEVIDNGIGLPKQNRGRLVEPYVTNREKGTGLGLAIVQKITEQHGGTLALEDAPVAPGRKSGALVRLTLPLAAVADKSKPDRDNKTGKPKTTTATTEPETVPNATTNPSPRSPRRRPRDNALYKKPGSDRCLLTF